MHPAQYLLHQFREIRLPLMLLRRDRGQFGHHRNEKPTTPVTRKQYKSNEVSAQRDRIRNKEVAPSEDELWSRADVA